LWHLQKCLQNILVKFIPSIICLYSPSPHSWNSFNRFHFHRWVHNIPPHSPSYILFLYPLPAEGYIQPPGRTCFTFLSFVMEKKRHFCLLKISIQRVLLWKFHVYMYYNPNWFIPSIFLLSILVLFLWWFQQVLKFYIYSCIESISPIFNFFLFLKRSPKCTFSKNYPRETSCFIVLHSK
jgi:hypothetical protein